MLNPELLREPGEDCFRWAESWNLRLSDITVSPDHPLLGALRGGDWVAELSSEPPADLHAAFGQLWLAVPLPHHR